MLLIPTATVPEQKTVTLFPPVPLVMVPDRSPGYRIPSWVLCKRHLLVPLVKEKACSHCNGEGVQLSEEVITLNIPAGVADGMQLSLSGKGNAARRGGVNGDLIILIEEIEHPELVRDGNDLLYNTFIGFPEAVLGDSVEIPTLEGKVKVKIEPGTQPGKILRLKGKGIPDINGYGKGDLLVKVNVWIPKNLSKEDKKTMEDLKERSFLKPSNVENKKGFFRKVKDFFE